MRNPFDFHPFPPSRICYGACDLGSSIAEEASFALLDEYVALGGNYIDTAHIYASWLPNGEGASERTVGRWLAGRRNRSSILLATKGGHPPMERMSEGRCGYNNLKQDLQESLERLMTDRIDLYWLHRDDPGRSVEEIIDALAALKAEGLIGSYGASNWLPSRIDQANRYAAEKGLGGFIASQPGWSLAAYPVDPPVMGMLFMKREVYDWHCARDFPAVAYTPQARGFFGADNCRWARNGFAGEAPRAKEYDTPTNRQKLSACIELAGRKGCAPNQVALAYLLHQPFPVYPIVGNGRLEHLREAMRSLQVTLADEEREALAAP